MKKKNIVATGAILGFALLLTAGFALPDFKATTKEAMKKKLAHSQLTLEGIAMEKFDIIERNAAALSRLSQTDAWRAIETDEYRAFTAEFRRQTDALSRAAKRKNIDAAALAYVQMTLTCVNCHKHVRDKQRVAQL